ncbi:hypothetical protein L3X38_021152 [Prunus dulcis]|uniref:Uncharacterized protein n=1 Tax=Prunus dulcis TaxID=3755 RepID=A0AAD4Z363_PRUDU|nr:hypothetical protein L3X38_021152 [Prunus dulcis]
MGDGNISQPSAALTLASRRDDLQGNLSEIEKSLAELYSQQLQLVDLKKSLMEELCLIQDACNHPRPACSSPLLTGLYVCLNRGDVYSNTKQRSTEAAGRSIVSIVVDHTFLCIKDTEFQLELLMQSFLFSRVLFYDSYILN